MIKALKRGIERDFLQLIKDTYKKFTDKIILMMKN